MAKNIDLNKLQREGLAKVLHLDVNSKHVQLHVFLSGDHTPKKVPYQKGDPQKIIFFESQTYQELGLEEGGMIVLESGGPEWRIVEVAGSPEGPAVSICPA